MAKVQIPPQFKKLFKGQQSLLIDADNIHLLLQHLEAMNPDLSKKLLTSDQGLNRNIRVFVEGKDIMELQGLKTSISSKSKVILLMALAGG